MRTAEPSGGVSLPERAAREEQRREAAGWGEGGEGGEAGEA